MKGQRWNLFHEGFYAPNILRFISALYSKTKLAFILHKVSKDEQQQRNIVIKIIYLCVQTFTFVLKIDYEI